MPSSQHQANPSQRERRCDWELEHLGFREGGSRKEEVGGRVAGPQSWKSRKGKGLGAGIPGFCMDVGTSWLTKVREVQVPVSGPQQFLALTH